MGMTAFDCCVLGIMLLGFVMVRFQMQTLANRIRQLEVLSHCLGGMLVDTIEGGSNLDQMQQFIAELREAKLKLAETDDDEDEDIITGSS